jgi:hypothetical protein
VELRSFLRSGIAASAIGHLSALALVLIFAEVHPFGSVTAEPIAVDLVAPDEVTEKKPEPPPAPKVQPSDSFDLSSKSEAPAPPPPAAPPPAAPPQAATPPQNQEPPAQPQKQAALSTPRPDPQQAAAQPQPQPSSAPVPAFTPPEPDISIKYHVMLGLPQDRPGDGFDAPASAKADVASDLVTEFRRHLRTCSTLPKSIAPSDPIRIKLRVFMTPDGKLATEPILIEASASTKGPALMQSAISALQACQPYGMLPADKYGEWKVLDLNFTPQDFPGAG